jgi:hypothetical protein
VRREDAARNHSSVTEILRWRKHHSKTLSECGWDAWASTPPGSRRRPQKCLLFWIPRRDFSRIRHSCATEVNPPLGQVSGTVAGSRDTLRQWLTSGNSGVTMHARPALYRECCMPDLNQNVKSAPESTNGGNQDRVAGLLKCGMSLQIHQFVEKADGKKFHSPCPQLLFLLGEKNGSRGYTIEHIRHLTTAITR